MGEQLSIDQLNARDQGYQSKVCLVKTSNIKSQM